MSHLFLHFIWWCVWRVTHSESVRRLADLAHDRAFTRPPL